MGYRADMSLTIGMITVDTVDAVQLAGWWANALGGQVVQENDGWFVVVSLGADAPMLAFQKVDDPTPGKNRLHLDLQADDMAAEVERLVTAGASLIEERTIDGSFTWTTLADPAGNQFCIATH